MKYFQIFAALILTGSFTIACAENSRRDVTTAGHQGRLFEGWACAPELAMIRQRVSPAHYCRGKIQDHLYFEIQARASENSIRANSAVWKQATCRQAARLQLEADAISRIVELVISRESGVSDSGPSIHVYPEERTGIAGAAGIYECRAAAVKTILFSRSPDWSECSCMGYMKIHGGRKGLDALVKRVKRRL